MSQYRPHQTRGRFRIERDDNWLLIDDLDASCIGFATRTEAEDAGSFARQYVKRHGDIDLCSFPYRLEDALHYDVCCWDHRERPWYLVDGAKSATPPSEQAR